MKHTSSESAWFPHIHTTLPSEPRQLGTIAGMTIEELREEYRHRLLDRYLPFWDHGGYDEERGGVLCYLNDDGSVYDDEKPLWFQARAVFIYSLLYNEFGRNPRHLDIAQKTRDFIVRHMNAGGGNWYQRVRADGTLIGGIHDDATGEWFYGMLYVVEGLAELYGATGNTADIDIVRETLHAALEAYEDPEYTGAWNYGSYPDDLSLTGFRVQSHSMAIIGVLNRLLSHIDDSALEKLQKEHVDLVMNTYYNPELGITNENLRHDFSRIEGHEDYMQPGHSLETLWIVMFEAIRTKNAPLFEEAASRFRRYLELGWDFVFEGFGDMHYRVFDGPVRTCEKMYETKSMWSHTELLIGLLHIYEYTGEPWAREWYERVRAYSIRTFETDYGVWRLAVDRFGSEKKLRVYSAKRKENYHFPRQLIFNLLSLDRMIRNDGMTTPFPR